MAQTSTAAPERLAHGQADAMLVMSACIMPYGTSLPTAVPGVALREFRTRTKRVETSLLFGSLKLGLFEAKGAAATHSHIWARTGTVAASAPNSSRDSMHSWARECQRRAESDVCDELATLEAT